MASVGLSEGCALAAGAWLGRVASAREGGKEGARAKRRSRAKRQPAGTHEGRSGRAWVRS